ncbi:TetR/AcrR family transcriptional regulator, partial [Nocardia flavorosea]
MNSPKLWRGQTLQDRSSDRREQILAVGEQLLGSGGVAAVTMRAVTRQANLSPRYFYETFDTREDLVVAVYDRVEMGLFERLQDVPLEAGLPAVVRHSCEICAGYFEEDPGRARILLREPLADDTLRRHRADRAPAFLRMLIAVLGAEAGAMAPRTDEDLAIAATALSGALVSLYLEWVDGDLEADRDRIIDAAVDIVFALVKA